MQSNDETTALTKHGTTGWLFNFSFTHTPTPAGRHYWIQLLCRVPEALGKGYIALGKVHTVKN